jgi:hypothetical protein
MGRHAIIEKLDKQLRKPIDSETQVVYLLVEIRKLIEIERCRNVYFSLNFHCDWALHAKLDGAGARRVLHRFDAFCEYFLSGKKEPAPVSFSAELQSTIEVENFRQELTRFLKSHELPKETCTDQSRWNAFVKFYSGVITDCPLVVRQRQTKKQDVTAKDAFHHLDGLVIRTVSDGDGFFLEWYVEYRNDPGGPFLPVGFRTRFSGDAAMRG